MVHQIAVQQEGGETMIIEIIDEGGRQAEARGCCLWFATNY
jgi:hypothetical protein